MDNLNQRVVETANQIYGRDDFKSTRFNNVTGSHNAGCRSNDFGIAYGKLGGLLFELELYKSTKDADVLQSLQVELSKARQYSLAAKSNNYSLFHGMSGLSSLYLGLYKCTGSEELLDMSVGIVKEYFARNSNRLQTYDSSGIANGTAGKILFCLTLYEETKEPWLLEAIERLTKILIKECVISKSGIYWEQSFIGNKYSNHSLMYGNAGVAFCFFRIGDYFNDSSLSGIGRSVLSNLEHVLNPEAYRIDEILSSSLRREGTGEPDLSFTGVNDIFSYRLVQLVASVQANHGPVEKQWGDLNRAITAFLDSKPLCCLDLGILNGLSYWGLSFKTAFYITNNIEYDVTAKKIASALLTGLSEAIVQPTTVLSLFNGLSGIGYTLLKIVEPTYSDSLVLPSLSKCCEKKLMTSHESTQLSLSNSVVNNLVLRQIFNRSLDMLNKCCPDKLLVFLASKPLLLEDDFIEWVKKAGADVFSADDQKDFNDTIVQELHLNAFKLRGSEIVDKDEEFLKTMDYCQNLSEEEFLALRISVSEKIAVVCSEKAVDFTEKPTPDFLLYLLRGYGLKSYFLRMNKYKQIEKTELGVAKCLLQVFASGSSIFSGLTIVKDFFLPENDEMLIPFLQQLNLDSRERASVFMWQEGIRIVKMLLMRGALVVSPLQGNTNSGIERLWVERE